MLIATAYCTIKQQKNTYISRYFMCHRLIVIENSILLCDHGNI